MDKEEQIIINKLKDLAKTCFNKDIPTYSDFLNLNEQSLLMQIKKDLPSVRIHLEGGYSYAERKIIGFYPDFVSEDKEAPIKCLRIYPAHDKFSQELNHRDFLGAILNLGLDRSKIGDIIVKENETYVFCHQMIANYIEENLFQIKHTHIQTEQLYHWDHLELSPNFKRIQGSVSSIRLDSVTALAFSKSRGQITGLIQGGKVFVNGKMIQSNSYQLRDRDMVSVRGLGKYIYESTLQQTRKGRYFIIIDRFI